jgi:hypothetical protein
MKIALFEYTNPGMRGINVILKETEAEYFDNKVRVSEFVEVEFPPRPTEELLPEQISVIDKQIAEVNLKTGRMLAELNARKQDLLALTDQREPISVD